MYIEEKILSEGILTKDHISELYTIYVTLCDNTRFKLLPSDFSQLFLQSSLSKDLSTLNTSFKSTTTATVASTSKTSFASSSST